MNDIAPAAAPSDEQVERMFRQLEKRLRVPHRIPGLTIVLAAVLGVLVGGTGVAAFAAQVVVPSTVAERLSQEELNNFADAGGNAEHLYLANEWGITPEAAGRRLDALNAMGTFIPTLRRAAGDRMVSVSVVEGAAAEQDHIEVMITAGPRIKQLDDLASSIAYPVERIYGGTKNSESIRATLDEIWPALKKTYPELGNYLYDPTENSVHLYYRGPTVSAGAVATLAGVLPDYLSVVPEQYVSMSLSPMGEK